jgi:septal ring factor EnvC (AmiA/AmiB activator)
MKTHVFLAIIAFLLGIALFGIFKSLALFKRNLDFTHKVGLLTMDLDTAQTSLKNTRAALSDSYMKSAELEGNIKDLETKFSKKEKEAKGLIDTINRLSQELKEASDSNENLSGANKELRDRSLRIELENSELKMKFSSIHELKLAIKELKIRMRMEKQHKPKQPATRVKNLFKPAQPAEHVVLKAPLSDNKETEGNMGFFIKDGKSTFDGIVNIEVMPVEERGL